MPYAVHIRDLLQKVEAGADGVAQATDDEECERHRIERGDELLFLTAREGESTLGEIPVIFTADDEPAPDPTRADPAPQLG